MVPGRREPEPLEMRAAVERTPCPGVEPSPCFPNFLARTTFVLVSLSEVKIPGQDAIFGDFVF